MNCRKILRYVAAVLLIVLFIRFFLFCPHYWKEDLLVQLSSENPSRLLKEAKKKLPLCGTLYTLDFMSIEYDTVDDAQCITRVTFGFSHYVGFDIYDAMCITYDGSMVEIQHMFEEAKTIYDDLYGNKGLISIRSKSLSRSIEKMTFSFDEAVAFVLNNTNTTAYFGDIDVDKQPNMIVLLN